MVCYKYPWSVLISVSMMAQVGYFQSAIHGLEFSQIWGYFLAALCMQLAYLATVGRSWFAKCRQLANQWPHLYFNHGCRWLIGIISRQGMVMTVNTNGQVLDPNQVSNETWDLPIKTRQWDFMRINIAYACDYRFSFCALYTDVYWSQCLLSDCYFPLFVLQAWLRLLTNLKTTCICQRLNSCTRLLSINNKNARGQDYTSGSITIYSQMVHNR